MLEAVASNWRTVVGPCCDGSWTLLSVRVVWLDETSGTNGVGVLDGGLLAGFRCLGDK